MEEIVLCQPIKKHRKQAKCLFSGCYKCPNYNYLGLKKRLYCSLHKLDGMVDVKNVSCKFDGCGKNPVFNYDTEIKGIFCRKHKLDGMINIKDKICEFVGCKTVPIFNYEGLSIAKFCKLHKLDDMVDIKNKKCEKNDCYKQPNYNFKEFKKARFCFIHKSVGMVDIKNKHCMYDNCSTIACFNYEGFKSGLYCSLHKLDGMIDIKSVVCIYEGCKMRASFNFEHIKTRLYCSPHKLEGMVNLYEKLCKKCKLISVSKKYDNHCLRCFIYLFPDKPVIRNYKTKETAVSQFVTNNFPNFTWNIDKKIEDGCSKRRPDLMCDLGYQVLIVEVDENQHESYDCSCENKRIMQISQDIGHRPLIFIRFNPDDYLDCSGNNVASCWTTTAKTGIIKIKNNKNDEWNKRLDTLKQQIEYWTNEENKIEKTIEIVQLFYDQNN